MTATKEEDDDLGVFELAPFRPTPKIDFGQVCLGTCADKRLRLVNPTSKPIHVEIRDAMKSGKFHTQVLTYDLPANGELVATFQSSPDDLGPYRHSLTFKVNNFCLNVVAHGNCVKSAENKATQKKYCRANVRTTRTFVIDMPGVPDENDQIGTVKQSPSKRKLNVDCEVDGPLCKLPFSPLREIVSFEIQYNTSAEGAQRSAEVSADKIRSAEVAVQKAESKQKSMDKEEKALVAWVNHVLADSKHSSGHSQSLETLVSGTMKTEKYVSFEQFIKADSQKIKIKLGIFLTAGGSTGSEFCSLLYSYNKDWLRAGLQCLVCNNKRIREEDNLRKVIYEHVFENKKQSATVDTRTREQHSVRIVKTSLLLIHLLDLTKSQYCRDSNGILFRRGSTVKSSISLVSAISKGYLEPKASFAKMMIYAGMSAQVEQTPLEDFDFRICQLDDTMKDGVRLARMCQVLVGDRSLQPVDIMCPTPSLNQKLHNVNLAWKLLTCSGLNITDISPKDITLGNKKKTIDLLWTIMFELELRMLVNAEHVVKEILFLRKYTSAMNMERDQCSLKEWLLSKDPTPLQTSRIEDDPIGASHVTSDHFHNEFHRKDSNFKHDKESTWLSYLLYRWAKAVSNTYGLVVKNLTTSLADGRVLCRIISHYQPELLSAQDIREQTTYSLDDEENPLSTAKCLANESHNFQVFSTAISKLSSVPPIIDVDANQPNVLSERCTLMMLAYLLSRLLNARMEIGAGRLIWAHWKKHKLRVRLAERENMSEITCQIAAFVRNSCIQRMIVPDVACLTAALRHRRRSSAAVVVKDETIGTCITALALAVRLSGRERDTWTLSKLACCVAAVATVTQITRLATAYCEQRKLVQLAYLSSHFYQHRHVQTMHACLNRVAGILTSQAGFKPITDAVSILNCSLKNKSRCPSVTDISEATQTLRKIETIQRLTTHTKTVGKAAAMASKVNTAVHDFTSAQKVHVGLDTVSRKTRFDDTMARTLTLSRINFGPSTVIPPNIMNVSKALESFTKHSRVDTSSLVADTNVLKSALCAGKNANRPHGWASLTVSSVMRTIHHRKTTVIHMQSCTAAMAWRNLERNLMFETVTVYYANVTNVAWTGYWMHERVPCVDPARLAIKTWKHRNVSACMTSRCLRIKLALLPNLPSAYPVAMAMAGSGRCDKLSKTDCQLKVIRLAVARISAYPDTCAIREIVRGRCECERMEDINSDVATCSSALELHRSLASLNSHRQVTVTAHAFHGYRRRGHVPRPSLLSIVGPVISKVPLLQWFLLPRPHVIEDKRMALSTLLTAASHVSSNRIVFQAMQFAVTLKLTLIASTRHAFLKKQLHICRSLPLDLITTVARLSSDIRSRALKVDILHAAVGVRKSCRGMVLENRAATLMQSVVRMFLVRCRWSKISNCRLSQYRSKTGGKLGTLQQRNERAVSSLTKGKMFDVHNALVELELTTSWSPACCECVVSSGVISLLFNMVGQFNRSYHHMLLLECILSVFRNVAMNTKTSLCLLDTDITKEADPVCSLAALLMKHKKNEKIVCYTAALLIQLVDRFSDARTALQSMGYVLKRFKDVEQSMSNATSATTCLRMRPKWDLKRCIVFKSGLEAVQYLNTLIERRM